MHFSQGLIIGFLLMTSVIGLTACDQDPWTEEEQKNVRKECMKESQDKSYCDCYVKALMEKYPLAEDAERISFEEAIEIAVECEN